MKVHAQRHRSGNHCQFFMDLPMTLRRYIVLHASGQGEKHTAYNKRSRPSALCRATVPPSPGKNLLPSKAENQANNPAFKAPVSTESGDHVPVTELREYLSGWDSQPYEYDYYLDAAYIEGDLPADLMGGTLFGIGPGLTKAYGSRVRNPSDGDGMLWSLAVASSLKSPSGSSSPSSSTADESVEQARATTPSGQTPGSGSGSSASDAQRMFFRNRFVRTASFAAEQVAGRRLSRGIHDRGAPAAAEVSGLMAQLKGFLSNVAKTTNTVNGSKGNPEGEWANDGSGGILGSLLDNPLGSLLNLAEAGLTGGGAGPLGPLFNPLNLSFRSAACSGVLYWAGKLYALSEHDRPHEMNKISLETVGESSMGGMLDGAPNLISSWRIAPPMARIAPSTVSSSPPLSPLAPSTSSSSALTVVASGSGPRVVLLSSTQSGPDAALNFWELDASGAIVNRMGYRLGGCIARFVTDFLVTDQYYIILQAPLGINVQRLASKYTIGEASFAECVDFNADEPAKLHLIPRGSGKGGQQAIVLDLPPMVLHSGTQAHELGGGSGQLVVDLVTQQGLPFHKDMNDLLPGYYKGQPKPELNRLLVNTAKGTVTMQAFTHRTFDLGVEVRPPTTTTSAGVGPANVMFACASASEDRENWGPPRVLVRLRAPPLQALIDSEEGSSPAAGSRPPRIGPDRGGSSSETWSPGPSAFLGPLLLVPKSGGGGGDEDVWLITTVHTAGRGRVEIVVFDGRLPLHQGPLCSILLPHSLPYPRDLQWAPRYLGPGRMAPASWKPGALSKAN